MCPLKGWNSTRAFFLDLCSGSVANSGNQLSKHFKVNICELSNAMVTILTSMNFHVFSENLIKSAFADKSRT